MTGLQRTINKLKAAKIAEMYDLPDERIDKKREE
jgi:hypothetical protein